MYKYILIGLFFLSSNHLLSTDYYCNPTSGSMSNDGSASAPWSTLHLVFATGKVFEAGDVIYLETGNHGFAVVEGNNDGYVEIRAVAGHEPILDRIRFGNNSASYWILNGITIRSENEGGYPENLIDLYPGSSFITIKNCKIQSIEDASDWTRDNWRDKANTGIRSQGHDQLIQGNEIKNIYLGAGIESPNTVFEQNTIQNFTIDGLRGLANFCTYEENRITDNIVVYDNDENHYDGFQSFTCCPVGSDTIFGVKIIRNTIIMTTDADRDFQGTMQGMGCFDGMFKDWEIENNLVITDHWHGISLYGAIDCKIINNTVIDPDGSIGIGPSWIKIATHKTDNTINSGALSTGNIIRNNIVNQLANDDNIGVVDHNTLVGASAASYDTYFVDAQAYDFHLVPASTPVDAGSENEAPSTDIENNPRPSGLGYDNGAYEYQVPNESRTPNQPSTLYQISPNPATNWIMIRVPAPTTITIFDTKGAVVFSAIDFESQSINIQHFGTGTYTILFITGKQQYHKKLIITK